MNTTLRLFTSINQGQGFVSVLPLPTWKRSTRLQGGFWQGSLSLRGNINDLIAPFYDWLGYHLNERTGSTTTWEGMIYELELAHGGSRRKRTLDLMYNAVKAAFTTMDFAGENLIANGNFESAGGGGADVFQNWNEGTGVSSSGSSPHGGAVCCQITSDGVQDDEGHFTNAYIRQNVNIQAGHQFRLTWWHRGSGSDAGWYSVRNPNAPTGWPVSPRPAGWPMTDWYQRSVVFSGPSQGEALIYFYPPPTNGNQAGYDDIELLEKTEVVYDTPWATNDQSIARFGRREDHLEIDNYPEDQTEDGVESTSLWVLQLAQPRCWT